MEALNFLKFWRVAPAPNSSLTALSTSTGPHLVLETDSECDEEDSFFDLEFSFTELDNKEKHYVNNNDDNNVAHQAEDIPDIDKVGCLIEGPCKLAKLAGYGGKVCLEPTISSPFATDSAYKRKVHPIEMNSKPQSPIALLKSAPSFRMLLFKKPKTESEMETQTQRKQGGRNRTIKSEEIRSSPFLSRANSIRSDGSNGQAQSSEGTRSEKMSKDIIQKYLKLIKPLYVKVSKRYTDKIKVPEETSRATSSSSPPVGSFQSPRKEKQGNIPAGIRGVCKHLGKSKSAFADLGVASPVNRRDDTLQQQHDGIQSAILHCKKSFDPSTDFSLRRSASDSTAEKSVRNSFEGIHGVAAI